MQTKAQARRAFEDFSQQLVAHARHVSAQATCDSNVTEDYDENEISHGPHMVALKENR